MTQGGCFPLSGRWVAIALFAVIALSCLGCATDVVAATGPNGSGAQVDAHTLDRPLLLTEGWRLHPGEEIEGASPELDDTAWNVVNSWNKPASKERWTEAGPSWLRLHLSVPPELESRPLAMSIGLLGAMEIYVDGQLLHRIGDLAQAKAGGAVPNRWAPSGVYRFQLAPRSHDHIIAVRFAPHRIGWVHGLGWPDGFRLVVGGATAVEDAQRSQDMASGLIYGGSAGAAAVLALLHLLLYAYHRRKRQNLYFALLAVCAGVSVLSTLVVQSASPTTEALYWAIAFNVTVIAQGAVAPMFGYHAFGAPRSRAYWVILGLAFVAAIGEVAGLLPFHASFAVAWIAIVELARTTAKALRRRLTESWLMAVAVTCYAGSGVWASATNSSNYQDGAVYVFAFGIVGMLIFSSAYLAREIGRDKRALQEQLRNIDRLNEEKLEQQRRQTELVHSEKMAAMARLVAGVAHEMNTPLGAVRSNNATTNKAVERLRRSLDRAQPRWQDDDKFLRSVDLIDSGAQLVDRASERLVDIVAKLRSFARLDEADLQRRQLHDILDDAASQLSHQFGENVRLVEDLGELPPIRCRPRDINQVVYNLLLNALQAIDGAGTISIETGAEDESVWFRIGDDGGGIPSENLDRIFDPGFTTRGVGVGTGLGLSICQQVVRDHGGDIQVTSTQGEGTSVTVTLPVSGPPNAHDSSSEDAGSAGSSGR
jgi:signal transduction histidine kinase